MMTKPRFARRCHTLCGNIALLIFLLLTVTACSMGGKRDGAPATDRDISKIPDAKPRIEPRSKQGNPESYAVFGRRYYVMDNATGYVKQGTASWYGTKFHGRKTSSGETYDMYKMTAAHKTLPLPSYVRVTNLDNKRQITVRVNDRGPFHQDRLIDLSYVAARKLGITANGTGKVEIRIIDPALSQNGASTSDATATLAEAETTTGDQPPVKNYFLQVGAFRKIINAEQLFTQLTSTTSRPVQINKTVRINENNPDEDIADKNNNPITETTLYRVRLGPFPDREQTQTVASELSALGFEQSQIIID